MHKSIIIVNHQTEEHLRRCLLSFIGGIDLNNTEVIVVDNDSGDGSVEMIRGQFPQVKLICLDENFGFSHANNIGIKTSTGRYILLLNSDTECGHEEIGSMARYMDANEMVGALGCRLIGTNGSLQLSFGTFPTFFGEILRKFMHSRLSINDPLIRDYIDKKYNGDVKTDWVSGACVILRRQALEKAGLFDHAFFMYFEDIDLCRRIKDAGWQVYYNSQISILHHGGVTASQNLARAYLEYRRSQLYFCKKYYGVSGLIALKFFVFSKFLIVALKAAFLYSFFAFSKEKRREQYIKLLLAKKIMGMIFSAQC